MALSKNKESESKKFNPAWLLVIFVPLFFIIGVIVWLSAKDGVYPYPELNGWQTLQLQNPGFWTWALIGIIVGAIAGVLAYYNASGAGKIGRKLPGSDGLTIFLIILALAFMCGPWGKACTDKTNSGVTTPNFKPAAK